MPKSEQAKIAQKLAYERYKALAEDKRQSDDEWFNEMCEEPKLLSENYIYRQTIRDCLVHFKLPEKVSPFHLCDIGDQDVDILNWQHSPGLPWTEIGFNTRAAVISDEESLQSIRRVWHLLKECQDINLPHSAFVRDGLEYPFTVYIQEACYTVPLLEAYSRLNIDMTSRLDNVCDSCCKLFYNKSPPNIKNIPTWLIMKAFNILWFSVNFLKYQGGGVPDVQKLYHGVWIEIIKYFINTPIRTQTGQVIHKTKGVPNGSAFAKIIITIVNCIVTTYCARKYEKQINEIFNEILDLQNAGRLESNHNEKKPRKVTKLCGKQVIGASQ